MMLFLTYWEGIARSLTQTHKGPLLLPLSEKRAFPPSAGEKPVNLQCCKPNNVKKYR